MVDQSRSDGVGSTQLPLRLANASLAAPLAVATPFGELAAFSAPSPGAAENQDAALADGRGLVAVVDGVGGNLGGREAARLAVDTLAQESEGPYDATRLLRAFDRANAAIQARTHGAMATLVAALIGSASLRLFAIGDAQGWLIGGGGKIKYRTVQHGPVGYAEEAGLIDEDEALEHEDRHLISNAVGDPGMRVEVGPELRFAPRDTLLLGSDGLFDNLYTEEIVDRIRSGPLDRGLAALAELASERMEAGGSPSKPDDLTIVACRPGVRHSLF